jgi:hypothetical protein
MLSLRRHKDICGIAKQCTTFIFHAGSDDLCGQAIHEVPESSGMHPLLTTNDSGIIFQPRRTSANESRKPRQIVALQINLG